MLLFIVGSSRGMFEGGGRRGALRHMEIAFNVMAVSLIVIVYSDTGC